MFPHEAQEAMAKVLFIIFAICLICMKNVQAAPNISVDAPNEHYSIILK